MKRFKIARKVVGWVLLVTAVLFLVRTNPASDPSLALATQLSKISAPLDQKSILHLWSAFRGGRNDDVTPALVRPVANAAHLPGFHRLEVRVRGRLVHRKHEFG